MHKVCSCKTGLNSPGDRPYLADACKVHSQVQGRRSHQVQYRIHKIYQTSICFPCCESSNASTVHLAVSQPICGAAVMCRPANALPVLPFVSSTNNCRSEHIHRMLLANVAVTTEQLTVKYMGLILAKRFILKVFHFSFY